MKIKYFDFPEDHSVACTIYSHGNQFSGYSWCHPDDYDFENTNTGRNIARSRAAVQLMKHELNRTLDTQHQLQHILDIITSNPDKYDNKSSIAKLLFRQNNILTRDIEDLKNAIEVEQESCDMYIESKEKMYQKLRDTRS